MRDVQKEDDGNEYRCVFKVSYTSSSSLILYYSAGAKLSTGGTEVTASLTITGHDETGRGTLTNPYRGKSDYQKNGCSDSGF